MRQDKAMVFRKALEAGHSTLRTLGREATVLGAIAMRVLLGLVSLAFCSTAAAQIVGSVSLNVERAGHSATRLGDGRILIAGGENAGGALSAAELYDPVTQRFALTGSLVVPRAEHTATLLTDGRVLIAGGRQGLAPPPFANHTATTPLASTEVFDPAKGSFSAGPPLTSARSGHTATVLSDGRILVAGGDAQGSAEIFDPTRFTFTTLAATLTTPRWFAGTALLQDGSVLIAGGADARGRALPSAEIFTPGTSSFAALDSTLQAPRENPLLRVLPDGKVLIIGGSDDSTVELFDPAVPIIRAYARVLNVSNTLADILRSRTRSALIHLLDPHHPLLPSQLTPEIRALLERTGHSLTELPGANQALVAGGADRSRRFLRSADILASSAATVTTDRSDYPPGAPVEISGTHWQPGETVLITIHEEPWPPGPRPVAGPDPVYATVADPQGGFTDRQFSPDPTDLGRTFTVTAVGQGSGFVAQTTFSDVTCISGTGANEAPLTAAAGAQKVPILSLGVSCSTTSSTLLSAQLTYTGTTAADISTLHIYRESGRTPGFQPSQDLLVGSVAITKTGTNVSLDVVNATANNVVSSAGATFYFAVDIKSGATSGHTVALQLSKTKVTFSDGGWPPSTIGPLGSTTITTSTATAVALTAGSNPSVFGQSLTYRATVTQSSGSSVGATGSVTFTDGVGGSALCGAVALDAGGRASCTTASLVAGAHQIVARYTGASNFASSESSGNPLSQTVNRAGTITTVSSTSATYGQASVTLTAQVTASSPSTAIVNEGTVTFTVRQGDTALGSAASGPVANGSATASFTLNGISATTYSIAATYDPAASNPDFTTSGAGTPGTLTVSPATTSTTLSAPTVTYNASGLVTVTVSSAAGTPTGTVSLSVDQGVPVSRPLTNGSTTITLTSPSTGDHALSASYTAQGNFAASGATGTLHVDKGTPVLSWSNPADITSGTALSAAQLNTTAAFNSAPVSGTFIYTPAAGTVLNVGNAQALHVDFTPTDTVNLAAAAKDVTINVLPAAPTIMGLIPSSGPVRAFVTVSGANFELEHTQVAFNGTPAVVISETTTTLTTTVPDGATTGPLTVATTKGTASRLFTVTPVGSFLLAAAPPLARVIAGDQASVSLLVEGTGNFGSLVALSMSAAPAGITTSLSPAFLVPNASGFLSLDVASSVAPGTYAFTISGQALVDGQTTTRAAGFMLQVLAPTTSAVTGRVLTAEAVPQPIPGATVTLGSAFTLTDAAGNFVLLAPPTGASMLLVDGRTASTPVVQYPAVEVNIDVASSGPTRIPFIIYLPRLDTAHPVTLPLGFGGSTTQAVQVTTPLIPGLAVTIPAGTTITGPDGNPVSQITITPVPIDRSPMPFPPGVTAPMLFTIQPGGAVPSQSLPITFPNVQQAPPGSSAQLYFFDLVTGSWAVWGTGTVSDDGTVIVSDPAFGLPRFAWHYAYSLASLLDQGRDRNEKGAEPVDLTNGRFVVTKTDLVLPGRIPVSIQRSYRSENPQPGLFGIGWNLAPYDTRLTTSGTSLILILPNQSTYLLAPAGAGQWANTTEPFLRGAVATQLAGEFIFQIRFKDGTVQRFERIFGYGNLAALTSITDRNGNAVTLMRDQVLQQNRITQITEPVGRFLTFNYDPVGRIRSITDPIGRVVGYDYDTQGRLSSVTDPERGTTTYTYDANHRILTITDPRGITFITNEYDANGRVTRQTQVDGGVWTLAYTLTAGIVTQTTMTDPRGQPTTYRFNSQGFTLAKTDALGQTTSFDYQPGANLLTAVTDPLGRVTRYTYDAQSNVTSITDPAGNVRALTYEPTFKQVTRVIDPLNHTTSFERDPSGNLTAVVDALGARTTIAYNSTGQPVSITDPLGHSSAMTYDAVGNLATLSDPVGSAIARNYDPVSRLLTQTDPRNKVTTFAYDRLNRLTELTDAFNGLTRFDYDGNGNLLTLTDARRNPTQYTYDSMDRVESRRDPLQRPESYVPDGNGNVTSRTDRKGQTTTTIYDALNRPTTVTYADGSSTTYTWGAGHRLRQVVDSVTGTITRRYDRLDRLIEEDTPQGTVSYTYDAAGRRTSMTVSGQAPVLYDYDDANRLTQISQGSAGVGFGYDAAGRRTSLTLPNGTVTEYTYDAASRLTGLTYRHAGTVLGTLTYAYDAGGNRTRAGGTWAPTALPQPTASSASYDAANRQLSFNGQALAYDANGSLVSDGVNTYTWNARNQLIGIDGPGLTASFGYDGLGRRQRKVINGVSTDFLYDRLKPVRELAGSAITADLLSGLRNDEYFTRTDDAGTRTFLTDVLGSTVALVDSTGAVQTRYTYEPFGTTAVTGPSDGNAFQFTGRENDGTGLYYYRARYYHPTHGRFISEDPLGVAGGNINPYSYVRNSPTNRIDPFGLADIYVWNYQGSATAWGHVSISLDDGTHISWWPQGGDVRDYPFGTTKIPIYSAPAYSDQSLQDDIAFEGRPPDTIIHLDNLDEAAIAAWWAKYTDDMTWKTLSKNCATTVADALKAGGGDIWAPNFSKPTFLWSPADVKAYAEAIQAGGPGGP